MTRPPTLVTILRQHATTHADHPALIDHPVSIDAPTTTTYAALADHAAALAAALRDTGVGEGDRVVHVAKDTPAVFELLYACATLGAVLVPISWRLAADEIAAILDHSHPRIVITDDPTRTTTATCPVLTLTQLQSWRTRTHHSDDTVFAATPDTPVVQMYTSGTTGRPKGVVLAHRSFFAVRALLESAGLDWIDWRETDINLIALPAFHIGGLWWATQGLNAGVTNVVIPAFTPATAIATIQRNAVTTTCLVPAMLSMMLSEPDVGATRFTSLRKIVYGGAPIGPHLLAHALDTFGCEFAQIYGLTETGNTALCLPPAEHIGEAPRLHAAGKPYPGVDIQIRTTDGTPTEIGESGEVFVRSPARMVEYFADPEATAATLSDGWIRTGDAGYLDADGYLVIRDRIKDLIIVGGENVYPAEVEKTLTEHPAVYDAAVVGAPDDTWGERVQAFVVAHPDMDLRTSDLARFLHGRLATFKTPTQYEFVDAIPRNPSGKILRRELREPYWADRYRRVN
ncbi:long-chain-fatty-acid--CoA ligase [Nocardia sp. CNY236]|uniref:long-chain-fatty-acid--CoA ligase n=1 Tax=Nocardia sp. CNY236 TaxID=1169152 RepID=UPI000401C29F|nr:long-chain-fatty-acid--CoA ligase [Nocardia sp. CNY236]